MSDKCGSELRYYLILQAFPETFHATNCSWVPSCKGCFHLWGPCSNVVRLGRIMGCWTNIGSNVAYHGWVCHAGVMMRRRDWALLWQIPFLLSTMHDRKGFYKSAEGNLLHSCLDPDARTCIVVTDGLIGNNIGLFEVFLWFSQSEKIFLKFSFQSLEYLWFLGCQNVWIFRLLGKYSAVIAIWLVNIYYSIVPYFLGYL